MNKKLLFHRWKANRRQPRRMTFPPPLIGAERARAVQELRQILRIEGKPSISSVAHRFIVGMDEAVDLLNEAMETQRRPGLGR